MKLLFDNDNRHLRNRTELRDGDGRLMFWGIYDFAFKYRTRIFDAHDIEIAYVEKDVTVSEDTVVFYDPANVWQKDAFKKVATYYTEAPEWFDVLVCKMKVDKNYYVSVKDLMNKTLPRPALKKTILVNDGEWLPIVTVETSI